MTIVQSSTVQFIDCSLSARCDAGSYQQLNKYVTYLLHTPTAASPPSCLRRSIAPFVRAENNDTDFYIRRTQLQYNLHNRRSYRFQYIVIYARQTSYNESSNCVLANFGKAPNRSIYRLQADKFCICIHWRRQQL